MAKILTLTTPISTANLTTWDVVNVWLDKEAPALKATVKSNLGERRSIAFIPDGTVTPAQILTGLSFINQGKFMTVQGIDLEDWLLKKIAAEVPGFAGTVSGTAF